jgi:hypothetical protein
MSNKLALLKQAAIQFVRARNAADEYSLLENIISVVRRP